MKTVWLLLVTVLAEFAALAALSSAAVQPKSQQPYPHYWMSVSTTNQNMPGMSGITGIAAMFGGGSAFGPRRDILLQLESPTSAVSSPEAFHEIPPALDMGKQLSLVTPQQEKPQPRYEGEHTDVKPDKPEKTRFRMLYYWGCGDSIGAGQPRVFDSEKSKPEDMARLFKGVMPTVQTHPAPHKGWTFGEWPSAHERSTVPKGASLVGEHRVRGNYTVDIPFKLDTRRDFMQPVELSASQTAVAGATKIEWKSIPTAIGYFATAMGTDGNGGDMIMWSASEVPENGMALMDYLTPGDVQRFIRDRIVIDPARTTCTIPPIFKDSAGAMLQFIAYGEQLDLVYPPKPSNPKEFWQPKWSVKVRLKSTSMTPLGLRAGDNEKRTSGTPSRKSRAESRPVDNDQEGSNSDARDEDQGSTKPKGGAVGNILRGVFGF